MILDYKRLVVSWKKFYTVAELAYIPIPDNFEQWSKSFNNNLKAIEQRYAISPLSVDIIKDNMFGLLRLKQVTNNKDEVIEKEVVEAFRLT